MCAREMYSRIVAEGEGERGSRNLLMNEKRERATGNFLVDRLVGWLVGVVVMVKRL